MTNNPSHGHSGMPILQRVFAATTHQRDSAGSTSNGTVGSFHSCSSIITHVESRWIVVDESAGGVPDGPEIKEGYQVEEIEGAEDISANDDDRPIHRTYQFDNCQVYMNSFNARGVKVKDSGNNAPRVTHHNGTAPDDINEGPSSSSELSVRLNTRPKGPRNQAPALGESSRHQDFPPDFTFGPPRPLPFQLKEDSPSYALEDPTSAPPVWISSEQGQPTQRDKLPATIDNLTQSIYTTAPQYSPNRKRPAPIILPGLESPSQSHPMNPFLPNHMSLHPNFLSHILQPFPGDAQSQPSNDNTTNNWNGYDLSSPTNLHPHRSPALSNSPRDRPDTTNPKLLEHHLESALAILVQTSGILGDSVTPQARNTLKAINALVSEETPSDPPTPRFKSVRKVARWLQIPRSPK